MTMLNEDATPMGTTADVREGMTVHTSATTGPARSLEAATTAALTSLLRTADERDLEVDVTTLGTKVLHRRCRNGDITTMVIATATGYPA